MEVKNEAKSYALAVNRAFNFTLKVVFIAKQIFAL